MERRRLEGDYNPDPHQQLLENAAVLLALAKPMRVGHIVP